jgi:protein-tyrosine-phosphatase
MDADGLGDAIRVASAGIEAHRRHGACEWTTNRLGSVDIERAEVTKGRAGRVTEGRLREAALILAADRFVGSQLIRTDPSARARMFSLKEAGALARLVLEGPSPDALEIFADRAHNELLTGGDGLDWLVSEMDAARGWLPMERPSRPRLGLGRSRSWSKALDVPDAHSVDDKVRHKVMFGELQPACALLAALLTSVLSHGESRAPRRARA